MNVSVLPAPDVDDTVDAGVAAAVAPGAMEAGSLAGAAVAVGVDGAVDAGALALGDWVAPPPLLHPTATIPMTVRTARILEPLIAPPLAGHGIPGHRSP